MEYFKTTTIISSDGDIVATLEDIEVSADDVVKLLAAKIPSLDSQPLPKKLKTITVKKAPKKADKPTIVQKIVPKAPKEVKNTPIGGSPRERTKQLRVDIWALKDAGKTSEEIADELGENVVNVLYYLKKRPDDTTSRKATDNLPKAPVAPPEPREIDKIPDMLTELDHDTITEEFSQGDSFNLVTLNHPDFSTEEIRRAKNFTEYGAYVGDYNRQYNK